MEAERVASSPACWVLHSSCARSKVFKLKGAGLEAAARQARYAALGEIARLAGTPVVATAHTRRDQAETLSCA